MSPELFKYYENRLAMFATQGWKDFIVDVQNMKTATNALDGVTAETLPIKQGELSMMNWLINIEEMSNQAYADLQLPLSEGPLDAENPDLRDKDGNN
jgi:hypothetical protein